MDLFLQALLLGVLIGGLYALQALGLTLIFGVVRVANFAHGAFFVLGGYGAYVATTSAGLPAVVGVLAGAATGMAAGYLTSTLTLRPLSTGNVERPGEYAIIVTFAISLLVPAGILATFGAEFQRIPGFWDQTVALGPVQASGNRLVAFGVSALLICVLLWVVSSTDTGRAWRALSQNLLGARVVGVNARAFSNRAFVASGALAGASAALIAPILSLYPGSGNAVLAKSFIAVIIGGLGSIPGSLAGGLLLGLSESLGSVYVSAAYADAYGFLIMAAVLLAKPTGLFGQRVRLV